MALAIITIIIIMDIIITTLQAIHLALVIHTEVVSRTFNLSLL
jgi:hypothetical protein